MNIIYLAAGTGSRMFPYTKNSPKCLLKIKKNLSIFEKFLNQSKNLKSLNKIFIVSS